MFYNEKGNLGQEPPKNVDPKYKHDTSEIERRAFAWKIAYVKRYFPQYYPMLKKRVLEIRKIMSENPEK